VAAASNLIGTMPDIPAIARLVHERSDALVYVTASSVRRSARVTNPRLATALVSVRLTASPTCRGDWVPPGPSNCPHCRML